MRAVVFVCMVFVGLFAQYLLTEWLETDSTEERKKTWDSVLKVSGHFYTQAIGNARWLMMGSNWKYLFVVPSRAKLYESRQTKSGRGLKNGFGVDGVKVVRIEHSNNPNAKVAAQKHQEGEAASQSRQKSADSPQPSPISPEDHFAGSKLPRDSRPDHMKFRVGQVVKHLRYGYYGVIVGWDDVAKAPEEWLRKNHPKGKEHWRGVPHYAVMVDEKHHHYDYTYCAQDSLVVVKGVQVKHSKLSQYFKDFDGRRYTPKPWLQTMYPLDLEP